jgi:hypothetical protein
VEYFLVLAGLVGLFFGGDWLVRGLSDWRRALGSLHFSFRLRLSGLEPLCPNSSFLFARQWTVRRGWRWAM